MQKITIRMNGVEPAYQREFGCSCARCTEERPRAHTSASIFVDSWGGVRGTREHHFLVDCGSGVCDSLIEKGVSFVSAVLATHGHLDHVVELPFLGESLLRNGTDAPIPLFATDEMFHSGPGRMFGWLFPKAFEHRPVEPGLSIELGPLCVRAVPVWHGPSAPGSVIWVLEFGSESRRTKVVLGWDLLHLIPCYEGDDRDEVYDGEVRQGPSIDPRHECLVGADDFFVAANTVTPCPRTGHISLDAILRSIVPRFRPKRLWLVHISSHEDPLGPLSDSDLQVMVDEEKRRHGLCDQHIQIAKHGMERVYLID